MRRKQKPPVLLVVSLLLFAAVALVLSSCSRDQVGSLTGASSSGASSTAFSSHSSSDIALAMRAQNAHTPELLRIPDVIGTGTGVAANGRLAVLVLTRRAGIANIPGTVDGVQTEVRVVGDVVPYAKPGGGGLQCGTSTGNNLECAAGTIGAVVLKGSTKYLLSNNHVYARENAAGIGEREDAPGRYDGHPKCAVTPQCGTLAQFVNISFSGSNTIDCAIALMDTGRPTSVAQAGGYTATSTVVAPSVGLAVKKTGRTSGLTHSTIQAINVTIQVGYTAGVATFTGQIMTDAQFIRSGDSGSLMVTETGNNPVGLCFAGGSGGSFENPIGPVLQAFGATIATQ
jgi:hypothetical protein